MVSLYFYAPLIKTIILSIVNNILNKNNNFLTSDKLYEKLIPEIINRKLHNIKDHDLLNLDVLLNNNYIYLQNKNVKEETYGWSKKKI